VHGVRQALVGETLERSIPADSAILSRPEQGYDTRYPVVLLGMHSSLQRFKMRIPVEGQCFTSGIPQIYQHLMKTALHAKKGSELLRPFASCQDFSHILQGQSPPILEAFAEQGSER
jgi:hypothetical protein